MQRLAAAVVLAASAISCSHRAPSEGTLSSTSSKLQNGEDYDVERDRMLNVAYIQSVNGTCISGGSGVFLTNRWILTAAHVSAACPHLPGEPYQVPPTLIVTSSYGEERVLSEGTDFRMAFHKQAWSSDRPSPYNIGVDIALIHATDPFTLHMGSEAFETSGFFRRIDERSTDDLADPVSGVTATCYGYGRTSIYTNDIGDLRAGYFNLIPWKPNPQYGSPTSPTEFPPGIAMAIYRGGLLEPDPDPTAVINLPGDSGGACTDTFPNDTWTEDGSEAVLGIMRENERQHECSHSCPEEDPGCDYACPSSSEECIQCPELPDGGHGTCIDYRCSNNEPEYGQLVAPQAFRDFVNATIFADTAFPWLSTLVGTGLLDGIEMRLTTDGESVSLEITGFDPISQTVVIYDPIVLGADLGPTQTFASLQLADFNLDLLPDLLALVNGVPYLLLSDLDAPFSFDPLVQPTIADLFTTPLSLPYDDAVYFSIADYDEDLYQDVEFVREDGTTFRYQGTPNGLVPAASPRGFDFDGDGLEDVAIGAPGPSLEYYYVYPDPDVDPSGIPVYEPEGAEPPSVIVVLGSGDGPELISGEALAPEVGVDGLGTRFGSKVLWGDFDGQRGDELVVWAPGSSVQELPDYDPQSNEPYICSWEHEDPEDDTSPLVTLCPTVSRREQAFRYITYNGENDRTFTVDDDFIGAGIPQDDIRYIKPIAVGNFDSDPDGLDDLVVGGFRGVFLLRGSGSDGLGSATPEPLLVDDRPGLAQGDRLYDDAVAGDFNCDGREDLAIAAYASAVEVPRQFLQRAGSVLVLFNTEGGLGADGNYDILHQDRFDTGAGAGGGELGDFFGRYGLAAGNFDGDFNADTGMPCLDLAVSSVGEDLFGSDTSVRHGAVNVFYGGPSGFREAQQIDRDSVLPGQPTEREYLGASLIVARVDNDPFTDLVIGYRDGAFVLKGGLGGLEAASAVEWPRGSEGINIDDVVSDIIPWQAPVLGGASNGLVLLGWPSAGGVVASLVPENSDAVAIDLDTSGILTLPSLLGADPAVDAPPSEARLGAAITAPRAAFGPSPVVYERYQPTSLTSLQIPPEDPNGDPDGDLVPNSDDNCPGAANPEQEDTDGDGTGDVCQCARVAALRPSNSGLRAFYRDGGHGALGDAHIKPHLQLVNLRDEAVYLADLTVRYWYTNEGSRDQQFWVDHAVLGSEKVTSEFVRPELLRDGADSYLEVGFAADAGTLPPGRGTGEMQLRFNIRNWEEFAEWNDYSFYELNDYSYDGQSLAYLENPHITVYENGQLVWGKEPLPAYCNGGPYSLGTRLRAQYATGDPGAANDNHLKPHLKIHNDGVTDLALSDITVRYWFTRDSEAAQQFWVDHAYLGGANVTGQFVEMASPVAGADTYVEVGFLAGAGDLLAGASSGPIQIRMNKTDWSNYLETDDYSFAEAATFADSATVTVYYQGELLWGVEPGAPTDCGNGVVDSGEECDDGNTLGGDGCSATCQLEPGCADGVQNGNESDVDCGGSCAPCPNGLGCFGNGDCESGYCAASVCSVAPTCSDSVQNQDETDVDCGGAVCGACADGQGCLVDTDCASGVCAGSSCEPPTCGDGVQNQDETDIDCGGTVCSPCGDGGGCAVDADCASGTCSGGICQGSVGTCSEATALDLGPQHTMTTVATDACLKVTDYPGTWVNSVVVQPQSGGSGYPVGYSWTTDCDGAGSGQLDGDWQQVSLIGVDSACATVISLQGDGSGQVSLRWWGGG